MKLSIIIPVYNEEQTIAAVVDRVRGVDLGNVEKEIIVANDGSDDGTQRAIEEVPVSEAMPLRVLHSPINLGKGAAVRLGMRYATGDIILTQDADLELDPNEYGALLAPLLDGADVVYGSRFLRRAPGIPRRTRLANRILTALTNVLYGGRLTDMETGYKILRREVLSTIRLRAVGFDFEPELTAKLLLAGHRIVEVPITYNPRRRDEGKKIRWVDGLDAVYMLLKTRLTGGR
jgi:glycosyltransferase involved in cell wall biosynthesis